MRKCTKCGEEKELALFAKTVKRGKQVLRAQCKKCVSARSLAAFKSNPERVESKRARERERQKRLRIEDPERLIKVELKRRETDGYKQWTTEYAKKQAYIYRFNRLNSSIGEVCTVEAVDCVICKCKAIVRTDNVVRKHGRRFCDNCNTKDVRVLGLKLERSIIKKRCIVCEKEYDGRAGGDKRCDRCAAEYINHIRLMNPSDHVKRAMRYGGKHERVSRLIVYRNSGYKCEYCGDSIIVGGEVHPKRASIDHVIALSKGGDHTYSNVVSCCMECNSSKGAKDVNEWIKATGKGRAWKGTTQGRPSASDYFAANIACPRL